MATKKLGSVKAVDTMLVTSVNLASEVTGVTPVGNGGTGQSSFTDGQILVGVTVGNTLAKVSMSGDVTITNAGVTAIGALKVTNAMLAGSIDLTAKVTGILPVANGGTGVSTSGTTAQIAVGGGTGSPIVWTTATGSGAPVRATSPALTTPTITTSAIVTRTGLGTTNATGIELTNTTAAAAAAQQISPDLLFSAQGWKTAATAASQAVNFREYLLPVQGTANPSANLVWQSQINAGGYTDRMVLTSGGNLGVGVSSPSDSLHLSGALRPGLASFVTGVGRIYLDADIGLVITAGTGNLYDLLIANRAGGTIARNKANSSLFEFNTAGDTIISGNNAAIATNAVEGFVYIPKCAGTPTGTPTNASFPYIPMVYDSTNNKIYFYNGGTWRGVTVT